VRVCWRGVSRWVQIMRRSSVGRFWKKGNVFGVVSGVWEGEWLTSMFIVSRHGSWI
jgi:hypothetical protein